MLNLITDFELKFISYNEWQVRYILCMLISSTYPNHMQCNHMDYSSNEFIMSNVHAILENKKLLLINNVIRIWF